MFDQAPPPEPPQAPIVITAKALPDPHSERAYSVEVLGKASLGNGPSSQLEEALQQVPGLQLFRRSDSRSAHPTSQGVTLRALGGNASSRALVILDGVPQSDPFGGWISWPAYDPEAIAEVRVVRGGGSVAHGPGALAGTILMESDVEPGVGASGFIGSRNSQEVQVHVGTDVGPGFLNLSGRAARGDGFIPVTHETRGPADRPAPYDGANVRALWQSEVGTNIDLQLGGSAFTDKRERGLAFTGNTSRGLDGSARLVGRGRWPWVALAYAQSREFKSSFAGVDDARATASRVALQDDVPSSAWGGSFEVRPPIGSGLELRAGGDVRLSDGQSRELFSYVDGSPTRRRRSGGEIVTAGLFTELAGKFGALSLSGGARIDHWKVTDGMLQERVIATGEELRKETYADRSGWLPTARLGALIDLEQGLSVRSAAYLGWRMPTLNELFRPFRAGSDATAANPLLKPERLAGLEAGIDYRSGGASLSLTAYANRLSDAIANVTLGQGPGIFPGVGFVGPGGEFRQRRNITSIDVTGVEASAQYQWGKFSLGSGASLVRATVNSNAEASSLDGLQPAQAPTVVLTGRLSWEDGQRAVTVFVHHSGAQFEDDLNARTLPSATTVNAFVQWPIRPSLDLVARAENLLDKDVVAGIGGDGSVERATPRTLWLGLRLRSRVGD
jgi:vitamin B12 transporter